MGENRSKFKDYADRAMCISSIEDMLTEKSGLKQSKSMASAEKSREKNVYGL